MLIPFVIIAIGVLAIIIGWKGNYPAFWESVTGIPTSKPTGPTIGSSGNFGTTNGPTSTPTSGSQSSGSNNPYTGLQAIAWSDAQGAGIDPQDFVNQIQAESGFNPKALSPAGAEGIALFMPSTASGLNVNPWDATASLNAAAKLMASYVKKYGNEDEALAAYNAGPGAVNYALSRAQLTGLPWDDFIPAETRAYIQKITGG